MTKLFFHYIIIFKIILCISGKVGRKMSNDNNYDLYRFKKKDYLDSVSNIRVSKSAACKEEAPHIHDFVELVYIMSGHITHIIDGNSYSLSRGALVFINYGQTHSFIPRDNAEYANILLTPTFFSDSLIDSENIYEIFQISMFREYSSPQSSPLQQFVQFSGDELIEIEFIINRMIKEFQDKALGYCSVLSGYMRVLFSRLLGKLSESHDNTFLRRLTPEVLEYIDKHCCEKITLAQVAAQCFYNPAYFSRIFKQYSGKNLSSYIQDKRMEKAAQLLMSEQELPIFKIMEQCGYSDSRLFYSHFKSHFSTTPQCFKEQQKSKKNP